MPSARPVLAQPPHGFSQYGDLSIFQQSNGWLDPSTSRVAPHGPAWPPNNTTTQQFGNPGNPNRNGYRNNGFSKSYDGPKPSFDGDLETNHPVEFLQELEHYVYNARLDPLCRLQLALSCLEGPAKIWARGFGYLLTDYEKFSYHFLQHYWGQRAQRAVREELLGGSYTIRNPSKMADYLLGLVAKARHLSTAPTELDIILQLTQHFPRNVAMRLSSCLDIPSAYALLQTEDYYQNNLQRNNFNWRNRNDNNSPGGPSNKNWRSTPNQGTETQTNRNIRAAIVEMDEEQDFKSHPVANIFLGSDELFMETETGEVAARFETSPIIEVDIDGLKKTALLDSGSELVTVRRLSQRVSRTR